MEFLSSITNIDGMMSVADRAILAPIVKAFTINQSSSSLSYCFLLYCQYYTIFQFSPYFVMHFHFCNVTWNETWNVPMFGADNIASLTDSCPRNINIKHRKSVSLSISAFTNTASHQAVGSGMFCVRNVYCHFRSKFISRQAPIQRNIKINANRPESAASFCATSSHHWVAIQPLIRRPFREKNLQNLLWWCHQVVRNAFQVQILCIGMFARKGPL